MRRRTRLSLLLLAGAAVLATLLWLSRPAAPQPRPSLVEVPRQSIKRIEIQPGDNAQHIVLARTRDGWRLSAPVDARADTHAVTALLDLAAVVPSRRLPATAIDAHQAGLTTAGTRIRFGTAAVIRIGARTPLNTRRNTRYLAIGDQVVLAPVPHANLLDRRWPQWLSPRILAPHAQLVRIHLPKLTLRRADNGGWRVIPESRDRGADAAQFLVDAWRRARAARITLAGDQPALGHITFVFADGHKRRLDIVAKQPRLLLRDPALHVTYHLGASRAISLLGMRMPGVAPKGADTPPARMRQ